MDNTISVSDYNSTIDDDYTSDDDYILTENTFVYYIWNNIYDLEHHINHEYINHYDETITLGQYNKVMSFLDELS
jgi:hypothetical protein